MSDPQLERKMEENAEPPTYGELRSCIERLVFQELSYAGEVVAITDQDQEAIDILIRLGSLIIDPESSDTYLWVKSVDV